MWIKQTNKTKTILPPNSNRTVSKWLKKHLENIVTLKPTISNTIKHLTTVTWEYSRDIYMNCLIHSQTPWSVLKFGLHCCKRSLSAFDMEISFPALQKYWANIQDHSWHIMLKTHFLKGLFILNAMDMFSLSYFYSIKAHQQVLAEIGKKWLVSNMILSVLSKGLTRAKL